MYTKEDVLSYVAEEEIKFIRLAFCDIFGKEKNIITCNRGYDCF